MTYEGPEVEDDLTNFQMLNIPPDHPARDLWDTLYVDVEGHLLRTHTSPGQIRVMTSTPPPIRALLPGRCYRYEAIDASHASEFFQVEGLMVDEGTTMGDLKGLLDQFAKAMYGARQADPLPARLLPVHGAVASRSTSSASSAAARAARPARKTGWMTILGAGMVHPVVLQYGGLDPERYQGFAFGMGVERIANLRHSVGDLRLYMENDLRFLDQFVRLGRECASPVLAPRLRRRRASSPRQLAERLTLLGMEVKGIERWGADWRNVVVGELLTVEKHPRADRLSLTTRPRSATAASRSRSSAARRTSRAGQRVPVALPGRRPARRPADRADREDGRRQQRHALLGRRAEPDRPTPTGS